MLGRALAAPGAAKNLLDLSQGLRERRAATAAQRAHAQVAAGPRGAGWHQQRHALAAEAEQGHVIAGFCGLLDQASRVALGAGEPAAAAHRPRRVEQDHMQACRFVRHRLVAQVFTLQLRLRALGEQRA